MRSQLKLLLIVLSSTFSCTMSLVPAKRPLYDLALDHIMKSALTRDLVLASPDSVINVSNVLIQPQYLSFVQEVNRKDYGVTSFDSLSSEQIENEYAIYSELEELLYSYDNRPNPDILLKHFKRLGPSIDPDYILYFSDVHKGYLYATLLKTDGANYRLIDNNVALHDGISIEFLFRFKDKRLDQLYEVKLNHRSVPIQESTKIDNQR